MNVGENSGYGIGLFELIIIAVALIESYIIGVPWYLGLGIGILVIISSSVLGLIPLLGQAIYYIGMKKVMVDVIGIWMPKTFYAGLVFSIVASLIWGIALLVILTSSNIKIR